ncbi:hypothetical protein V6N13_071379 [Hibiscus sabdariffa]
MAFHRYTPDCDVSQDRSGPSSAKAIKILMRRVWLSVCDLPIHAWLADTIRNIAKNWRTLVQLDDEFSTPSFERCRFQIETDWQMHIEETFNLHVENNVFPIRVVEIEETIGP